MTEEGERKKKKSKEVEEIFLSTLACMENTYQTPEFLEGVDLGGRMEGDGMVKIALKYFRTALISHCSHGQ